MSIVNYKIILYNLLLQGSKALVPLFRKITGCVYALSSLLYEDQVSDCQTRHHQSALFALWKALQYQFIIEQYAQVVQSSEKNETPLMIKKCYALHTFYLREAYAIHLESVLAAPTPDASLSVSFLQFADFASEKEYCEVYEIQVRVGGASECEDRFPNPLSGVAPK